MAKKTKTIVRKKGKKADVKRKGEKLDFAGAFGISQADDGKMAFETETEQPAGGDETATAQVVTSTKEGSYGAEELAEMEEKEEREKAEEEGESEDDGMEASAGAKQDGTDGEGAQEKSDGATLQAAAAQIGAEAGAPAARAEGAESAAPRFMRVQTNLSQVDTEKVLEAALFMAGQPISAAELAKLVGIAAIGHVDEKLVRLASKYEGEASAIEIVKEESGKWSMRVKAAYAPSVKTFAGEAEISRHALKTLAFISRSEGIKKRDLFTKLGSTIYEDVAELVEKGFVSTAPAGRTVSLRTTAKFAQYFEG